MKKVFLLLAFNLVFFSITYAQIKWGIGAGPHNTTVIEKNNLQGWDQQYKGNFTPFGSFHAGLFSEINIGKNTNWAIQPAIRTKEESFQNLTIQQNPLSMTLPPLTPPGRSTTSNCR